jgi:hypothetical protein
MSERERFMREFESRLRLRGKHRTDALAEIESHIEEGVAAGEDERAVIARLGEPREVARALNALDPVPVGVRPLLVLVAFLMLVGVAAVAFVDYEMTRADAASAGSAAANARITCLYGSRVSSPAEFERRHARCEQLPLPRQEAARVERRWDRRGPLYGFAAGAILLATAAMFVRSKRLGDPSVTHDPALSRVWRIATIAVRFAAGITIWAALVYVGMDRWEQVVEATGGSTHDCHYPENDCGVLGEFTEAHPLRVLSLIAAAAAIPAAAIIWSFSRLLRSLGNKPQSQPRLGPPMSN